MGGERGRVAGRQHETAKGSYGLTGNDVFDNNNLINRHSVAGCVLGLYQLEIISLHPFKRRQLCRRWKCIALPTTPWPLL